MLTNVLLVLLVIYQMGYVVKMVFITKTKLVLLLIEIIVYNLMVKNVYNVLLEI